MCSILKKRDINMILGLPTIMNEGYICFLVQCPANPSCKADLTAEPEEQECLTVSPLAQTLSSTAKAGSGIM